MNLGKWFLVYTYTDELEAGFRHDGINEKEIELNAKNEEEAVKEADKKWKEIAKKSMERFEKQKEIWEHPPKLPTDWGPRNPKVIYKIPLTKSLVGSAEYY